MHMVPMTGLGRRPQRRVRGLTLLEVMPRIVPVEDEDCSAELAKEF